MLKIYVDAFSADTYLMLAYFIWHHNEQNVNKLKLLLQHLHISRSATLEFGQIYTFVSILKNDNGG